MVTLYDEIQKSQKEEYFSYKNNLVNSTKIILSYKNIICIGNGINELFFGISKLYLSNNKISNLKGIEVFRNLTHFSISYNNIEKIEELDRIINKDLVLSLSVKGNLFCKNPIANVLIMNKFKNLKDLDGFKISEATLKVIDESKKLRNDIIPFIYVIQENINRVNQFIHTILINLELESKFTYNQICLEEKLFRINNLLNKIGIIKFFDENKYLKKNINPSAYIIKKIIQSFTQNNENYLKENFKPRDKNSVNQIYEKLFKNLIQTYYDKKNFTELPFYLNYLIIKSNPMLQKFLIEKMKDKFSEFTSQNILELNESELLKLVCKNLDRMFTRYTNYEEDFLIKLQMIHFYYLQPPMAKIISDYNKVFENLDKFDLIEKNENLILTGEIVDIKDKNNYNFKNPFTSRLNTACDIFPMKNKKIEFVKSNLIYNFYFNNVGKIDYEFTNDFSDINIEFYFEDGEEKANLDLFYTRLTSFLNNYSPMEFPLFALNFDYMRILTSLIQEKIFEYLKSYDKIQNIINEIKNKIEIRKQEENNINQKFKYKNHNKSCIKSTLKNNENSYNNLFFNDIPKPRTNKFIESNTRMISNHDLSLSNSNSKSRNQTISRSHSKENKNILKNYTPIKENLNNSFSQQVIENIIKKKENYYKLSNIFNKVLKSFYFKKLKLIPLNDKIKILNKTIQSYFINQNLRLKRRFFLYILRNYFNIEEIRKKRNFKLKNKIFGKLKSLLINEIKMRKFRNFKLKQKTFYKILMITMRKRYKRKIMSKSRIHYYKKIISKIFQKLKYNKFIKEENKNNFKPYRVKESLEVNDFDENKKDTEYSQVFSFFHGNNKIKNSEQNTSNNLEFKNFADENKIREFKDTDSSISNNRKNEEKVNLSKTNIREHKFQQKNYDNYIENNNEINLKFDLDEEKSFTNNIINYDINNDINNDITNDGNIESEYKNEISEDYNHQNQNEVDELLLRLQQKYKEINKRNKIITKEKINKINVNSKNINNLNKNPNKNNSQRKPPEPNVYLTTQSIKSSTENSFKKSHQCQICKSNNCHHIKLKNISLVGAPSFTRPTQSQFYKN